MEAGGICQAEGRAEKEIAVAELRVEPVDRRRESAPAVGKRSLQVLLRERRDHRLAIVHEFRRQRVDDRHERRWHRRGEQPVIRPVRDDLTRSDVAARKARRFGLTLLEHVDDERGVAKHVGADL